MNLKNISGEKSPRQGGSSKALLRKIDLARFAPYLRGRHLDPENRDFGIGIEKNGVGTGRDGVFDPDFFRDGTGWGFSIPIFSGRDGIEKKLNRDPDLMIFSSFFC